MIPILYADCEIPEILKPIYHLNYQDSSEHSYFWKRLAASLGYIDQDKPRGSPLIDKKTRESPRGSPRLGKKSNENVMLDKKSKGGGFKILRSKK